MARTTNVFARVEPELKEQAEAVLNQLGVPMSNAIGLFLRQVVLQRGIPFDMKLPNNKPISIQSLTKDDLDMEISKGIADIENGHLRSAEDVFADLKRDYGA